MAPAAERQAVRRHAGIIVCFLGCLWLLPPAVLSQTAAPFAVTIVPERSSHDGPRIQIAENRPSAFFVVLTNVSSRAQAIFETSSSWGYRAVSFEMQIVGSPKVHLVLKRQDFTRNLPSTFIVPPGADFVFPVQLDAKWENLPRFEAPGDTNAVVTAIYSVAQSGEASENRVWVGTIRSKALHVTAEHW